MGIRVYYPQATGLPDEGPPLEGPAENSSADTREDHSGPLYYRGLFSLAILGILALWLRPLYHLGAAAEHALLLRVLMVSAALILAWGCLQLPRLVQAGGQLLLIFTAWYRICAASGDSGWLMAYAREMGADALLLLSGRISSLSEDSRLLILVLGWGLLVSSVQQLALYRGSITLFAGVTLAYLLVLEMVYALHTSGAILLSAGLILWLRSLSGLLRLQERTGSPVLPYARWGVWTFAAAAMVIIASWIAALGFGARPAVPFTLQPVLSRLEQWAETQKPEPNALPLTGTTGYSLEDNELGMALTPGKEAIYTVTASEAYSLRGESKTYYDGRRWIRSAAAYTPLNLLRLPEAVPEPEGAASDGAGRITRRIQFVNPSPGGLPLFSAGSVADVQSILLTDGSRLGYVLADPERVSFRLPDTYGSVQVSEYTVKSVLPVADPAVLRKVKADDPEPVKSQYLQLPATLPARVRALGKQLTAEQANRYDAAAAVAAFLQSRYTYTLKTRVPPPGAEFTDDFLFGTRRGYCVHFATAMTILLRSSGIPARYVQGYGPGTLVSGSLPQRYTITAGDAHAWVEVYFPGAGWVPFDPTPAAAAASAGAAATAAAASSAPPLRASAALRADALPAALPQAGGPDRAPLAAAALVLAAAVRWRRSLALLPAVHRAGRLGRERQLRAAALAWHGLAARYGAPPPGATAREYADSLAIADRRLRAAVRGFVRQWETLAYGAGGAVPPAAASPGGAESSAAATLGHAKPLAAASPGRAVPSAAAPEGAPPPHPTLAAIDAEAFLARCLMITFHLT